MKSLGVSGLIVLVFTLMIQLPVRAQTVPTPSPLPAAFLGAVTNATANGAYIGQIVPGSPAEKAGLLVGDVIETVNGVSVTLDMPLNNVLKNYPPGAIVQLVVGRGANGAWLPIRVTLGIRQPVITTAPTIPTTATVKAPTAPAAGTTVASNAGFLGIGLINTGSALQIAKIAAGSPAETAGIQIGDTLISLDGQPMTTVPQVQAALGSKPPGTRVTIIISRNNQSMTLTATLSAAPGLSTPTVSAAVPNSAITMTPGTATVIPAGAQSDIAPTSASTAPVHLGVTYDVVTPALAAAKQLPVTDGAYIVTVEAGSPAAAAGLQMGDVVIAVDGDKVDIKHTLAIRLVAYNAGDTFKLSVVRGTQTLTLTVTLATRGAA
jgi:S1-C subfamily serine protease